ncbi:hypothetical protein CVD28_03145 [Bacillus sp. M6-12]|uniref:hypothetical protein n=1 Tax=Bacillus sp. M6-12 TaxID=2054166 RepID=UPI000C7632AC|nr:hypothetical protein [Bacillus sp. M6-12]PLS19426.1 hypothetical protein CVD28_03145 [Bacillus sp. M6-12]
MAHISLVQGDFVVGYKEEDYKKYEEKKKELIEEGYVLFDTDYALSGDKIEVFTKEDKTFTFTHLAI